MPQSPNAPANPIARQRTQWFHRYANGFAIANVIVQVGIVLTGGLVRLTGSGLGCSTWPMCEPGEFTPRFHEATSFHPFIEFGNRTLTGVLVVVAILLVLSVTFDRTRPVWVRRLAALPLVGTAIQAVLGGITVLVDLHPAVVGSHFFISIVIIAISAMVQYYVSDQPRPGAAKIPGWLIKTVWAVQIVLIPVVILGVITTGSGPHSGDAEVGYRFAFDPMAIARFHALSVWVYVALLALIGYGIARHRHVMAPQQTHAWLIVVAITLIQGGIGYFQTFYGLPVAAVAAHMLLAGVLTVVSVRLGLFFTTPKPIRIPGAAPATAA
ncbi:COX15/CtaA family protein [Jonesia quinghaiensis]|uniref:COX15/CtaA family protein n=1 Tax=Jonesia quinghaiensis TaxID=262806 RepID=UPI00040ADFD3|nr:COX15/CtaA family protein [Jonesia quinghaiensis]